MAEFLNLSFVDDTELTPEGVLRTGPGELRLITVVDIGHEAVSHTPDVVSAELGGEEFLG